MKTLRWIVGVCLAAGLATFIVQAQGNREVDITGYYNEKDGEFTKISRSGTVYQYFNQQKAGQWIGVGIREGDTLSIAWQRADGRNLGVSVYKITKGDKGPVLTGEWAAFPGGGTVKDGLTWSRRVD
jgi:hypothetical protein